MNIKSLKNKKILLFGKSRSFSQNELLTQLKVHNIELVKEYDEGVDYIVEGAMMTPLQTTESENLYNKKVAEFLNIEVFEKMLTESIDEDVLMMSLKLSSDTQRLKNFLTNPQISDEFYFRLLKMYNWGEDDFYESDDNRDVSASLIRRFYKNIERNHNVEFSKLGLMHLVLQCNDKNIIETIANLKPLRKSFKTNDKDHGYRIVTSIATHNSTSKQVLKLFIKEANTYVKTLIAMRKDIDEEVQNLLYETGEKKVLEALSCCENLSDEIFNKFLEDEAYSKNMAKYIKLDVKKYDFFKDSFSCELAQNENINPFMQGDLLYFHLDEVEENLAHNKSLYKELIPEMLKHKKDKVDFALYSNPSTPKSILELGFKDEKNYLALALNKNTPQDILYKLYESDVEGIKMALSKNISTPVDILYQLQLDSRFERYVKENPSFGRHIQQENIGWQI
ncbi:hypothetical protein FJR48_09985 [Sulfurimonas lithotrophica]|uniref:Leucine rich repeat variant n=1 Tax=Sulfurimonas lithotrophica TaxID=2590022 RepID=A0A5P8P364_9BACT|nr:hypothetical protein [Sulfurimonas lithotrophica]QFR50037.1 hypothetical protein FJR48_09985 [Sulfurimonas lithotrophica]